MNSKELQKNKDTFILLTFIKKHYWLSWGTFLILSVLKFFNMCQKMIVTIVVPRGTEDTKKVRHTK